MNFVHNIGIKASTDFVRYIFQFTFLVDIVRALPKRQTDYFTLEFAKDNNKTLC